MTFLKHTLEHNFPVRPCTWSPCPAVWGQEHETASHCWPGRNAATHGAFVPESAWTQSSSKKKLKPYIFTSCVFTSNIFTSSIFKSCNLDLTSAHLTSSDLTSLHLQILRVCRSYIFRCYVCRSDIFRSCIYRFNLCRSYIITSAYLLTAMVPCQTRGTWVKPWACDGDTQNWRLLASSNNLWFCSTIFSNVPLSFFPKHIY